MKIIAFGHRKRVGKDTAAGFLITELRLLHPGISIVKAGFADKVKDVAYQLYSWAGLKNRTWYDEHPEERETILPLLGKTPRELWIGIGNGVRSATGYDGTWFDFLFHSARLYKHDVLVIGDIRFYGEADAVRLNGGDVNRINNPRIPKVVDGADEPLEDYPHWTNEFDNSLGLKELHAQMKDYAKRIVL